MGNANLGDQQLQLFKSQKVTKNQDIFLQAYLKARSLGYESAIHKISRKDVDLPQSSRVRLMAFLYCAIHKKRSSIPSVFRYLRDYHDRTRIGKDSWFDEVVGEEVKVEVREVSSKLDCMRKEKVLARSDPIGKFVAENPDIVHPYGTVKEVFYFDIVTTTKTTSKTKAYIIRPLDISELKRTSKKKTKPFTFKPGKVKLKQNVMKELKASNRLVEASEDYKHWLNYLECRQKGKRKTRGILLGFNEFKRRLAAYRKEAPIAVHQMSTVVKSMIREERRLTKVKKTVEKKAEVITVWKNVGKSLNLGSTILYAHFSRNKSKGKARVKALLSSKGMKGKEIKEAICRLGEMFYSDCAIGWYSDSEILDHISRLNGHPIL